MSTNFLQKAVLSVRLEASLYYSKQTVYYIFKIHIVRTNIYHTMYLSTSSKDIARRTTEFLQHDRFETAWRALCMRTVAAISGKGEETVADCRSFFAIELLWLRTTVQSSKQRDTLRGFVGHNSWMEDNTCTELIKTVLTQTIWLEDRYYL